MPNLLQINATCNWGSTGHIAEQIAAYAKTKGWGCYLAHGARYINDSAMNTYMVGSKTDNLLHVAKSMLLGQHGLGSKSVTLEFVKYIDYIGPDVIHLHNIHGYYLNYQILFEYLKRSGVPVVWTFHDCWPMTGQCTHFVSVGCEKWKETNGCHHCPLLGESYKTYVDRSNKNWHLKKELFASLDNLIIVPVSHWLEGIVKESYFKNKHIQTIHNGVDTDVFVPLPDNSYSLEKYSLYDTQYVMGVSTDWSDKKGFSDYCKLSSQMPSGVKIVLLGLDEEKCRIALQYGIIGLKRTDNVDELVQLYNGASIIMSLSYEETFGLTTVEGFACGVPGIVYNATASPELVSPETGIVVEPGNLEEVVRAIRLILGKGKVYFSQACRERAVKLFNKDERYEEYVRLYEEVIQR